MGIDNKESMFYFGDFLLKITNLVKPFVTSPPYSHGLTYANFTLCSPNIELNKSP